MVDFTFSRNFKVGETVTQEEAQRVFNTNFGFQWKGVTLRTPEQGKYVIVMSNEGEIYDDQIGDGPEFTYDGEGRPEKGDQELVGPNEALVNAVTNHIPIYLFTSEEGLDEYEYRGLVEVEDYRYVYDEKEDRKKFKFDMRMLGVASWEEYQGEVDEIEEATREEPTLDAERSFTESKAAVRSSIFNREVKREYDYSCAVCSSRILSPEGNPEVEAAHVFPKSEGGPDEPRNGISLCRFHHWAYDIGWFTLTDDLRIQVRDWGDRAPPEDVQNRAGDSVLEPEDPERRPHRVYVEAHRKLNGFQ